MPCNNVPADKARFEIALTVPERLKAVSNGTPHRGRGRGERAVSPGRNHADEPLPRARRHRPRAAHPRRCRQAAVLDPDRPAAGDATRGRRSTRCREIIRLGVASYGPYPFDGGRLGRRLRRLGYALETQTRPIYVFAPDRPRSSTRPPTSGSATRSASSAGPTSGSTRASRPGPSGTTPSATAAAAPSQVFAVALPRTRLDRRASGTRRRATPGSAKNLFAVSTYVRGAMALQALRIKIGTAAAAEDPAYAGPPSTATAAATSKQFIALAEQVSGEHLGPLFGRWLFQRGKPLPR